MSKFKLIIEELAENYKKFRVNAMLIPLLIAGLHFTITFINHSIYGIGSVILSFLLIAASVFIFGSFSDHYSETEKKDCVLLIKVQSFFSGLYIVSMPWFAVSDKIPKLNPAPIILACSISYTIAFAIFLLTVYAKKITNSLKGFSLQNGFSKVSSDVKNGIFLCDTKIKNEAKNGLGKLSAIFKEDEEYVYEPEIIPEKDRFLHMLILGPTGSGKTSQILIPMIHQDVQNKSAGVVVLDPKGDLAQKIKMMAKYYDREALYFDPAMDDCPFFNPLAGQETAVIENMATTFRVMNPDSPTFFLNMNEQLIRNGVKVLKRLDAAEGVDGKYSTFITLSQLVQNANGLGRDIVSKFAQISSYSAEEAKENSDIVAWFLNDYFAERSQSYEHTSDIRSQIAKLCSNEYLRHVLNPNFDQGEQNDIDFDKALANNEIICMSTSQGTLGQVLSRFLGYFLILQFQSAVFRRPGTEDTRPPCFLYIDEFQTYSNPGFADMLTMGRSYRVASHLATQARAQMAMGGGSDGKAFVELVSTNARNLVIFPGGNHDDAKYYSNQFGKLEKTEEIVSVSRKKFNFWSFDLNQSNQESESIRVDTKDVNVFDPHHIIYRPFGEMTYCIIKNNSIQTPKVGRIAYIPYELNKKIDADVAKYLEDHTKKSEGELRSMETTKASSGLVFEGESFEPDTAPVILDISEESTDVEIIENKPITISPGSPSPEDIRNLLGF